MTLRERILAVYRGETSGIVPYMLHLTHWFCQRWRLPCDLNQVHVKTERELIDDHKGVSSDFYSIFRFISMGVTIIWCSGCVTHNCVVYRVVDDERKPVIGARVFVSYQRPTLDVNSPPPASGQEQGFTDQDGFYVYSGFARNTPFVPGSMFAQAAKDGYYDSFAPQVAESALEDGYGTNRNKPVVVILRRMIKPVPMFAKQARIVFPEANGSFGYDLMQGNLVAPHGTGLEKDFIFNINSDNQSKRCSLDISFPNADDGIQYFVSSRGYGIGSKLRSPQLAPPTGYCRTLSETVAVWREKYRENLKGRSGSPPDWINYFFRVRSKSSGKCFYGKIYGSPRSGLRDGKEFVVELTYFLNPDGTNHVEFDSKRNLMKRFGDWEYAPLIP